MASYRYRTEVPAKHIGASINGGHAEIAVFSKPFPEDVDLAKQCKESGAKVVVDLCDPHTSLKHYQEIIALADHVVVASEWARENIFPNSVVIPDPYEFEEIEPHCHGEKYLWFGHKTNLKDMDKWRYLPNLRIVSGPFEDVPEGITFYSPENLRRALIEADFTLFPSRAGAEYKSPNRLLNALRMGTFPICHPVPSYKEFRDFVWVGDMLEGLRWSRHQDNLNDLIKEGQDYIRDRFSPQTIGELWRDFLSSI